MARAFGGARLSTGLSLRPAAPDANGDAKWQPCSTGVCRANASGLSKVGELIAAVVKSGHESEPVSAERIAIVPECVKCSARWLPADEERWQRPCPLTPHRDVHAGTPNLLSARRPRRRGHSDRQPDRRALGEPDATAEPPRPRARMGACVLPTRARVRAVLSPLRPCRRRRPAARRTSSRSAALRL